MDSFCFGFWSGVMPGCNDHAALSSPVSHLLAITWLFAEGGRLFAIGHFRV